MSDAFHATCEWAEQRNLHLDRSEQTPSTNDTARGEAFLPIGDFKLYVTNHQTQGRGRGTNTWTDTGPGECLLSSWSFALKRSPQPIAGPCMGLALFRAASFAWPDRRWSLKAPNDLYLDGKKIAGILLESVSDGKLFRIVVGIGMNILNHPRALENSTHLTDHLDQAEWFRFLNELLMQIQAACLTAQETHLSLEQCEALRYALNANPNKAFTVIEVSREGDLRHSQGVLRWMDL